MRLSLPYLALSLSLVLSVTAQTSSSNTYSNGTSTNTELLDEAIEIIHSGGDPLGDESYVEPVRRSTKHKHGKKTAKSRFTSSTADKGAKLMTGKGKVTWYASNDLKNPQCVSASNWNPNNNCHIGAVMAGWSGGPKCGEFVQICNEKKKRCIKVRIVDKCAGCKKNHIDLTKSAFRQLSPSGTLTEGVVDDLKVYRNSKPNPWDADLFGPLKIQ